MKVYRIGKAAEFLGYTVKTLQKWDRDGILVANRTKTNRRYYTEEQLYAFLGKDVSMESL